MSTTWTPAATSIEDAFTDIRYEKSGAPEQGIAKITIARPEVRNAFRPRTIIEISRALEDAREDTKIGVVILTGEGADAFCSGGDQRVRGDSGYLNEDAAGRAGVGRFHVTDLHLQIRRLPKPVVAMVAGYAIGGGHVLHLVCDLTIAADNARFGQPEITLGTIPGAGGTQRLPRFVGKSKAMDLVLTGRMMDAAEAERCGLVSRVVPLAQLMDEALAAAEKIAGLSLPATMVAKEAVNRAFETTLAEGVRFERRTFHATFAFEDRAEGMAAFADKRKAAWKHR